MNKKSLKRRAKRNARKLKTLLSEAQEILNEIDALKASVKEDVKKLQEDVILDDDTVVRFKEGWSKGATDSNGAVRGRFDAKMLRGMAAFYPQIMDAFIETERSASAEFRGF